MQNVVLIGMPGVGKSSIGVVLAKVLGYEFLDSDLVIQKQEGKKLSQIISDEGIQSFLEIENRVNRSLDVTQNVIATGGSAVYGEEAMEHLHKIGTVVYLKVTYDTIIERLGDLTERGVIMKEGQTLKDLYRERCPLYEKYADITINEEHLSIREAVQKMLSKLAVE